MNTHTTLAQLIETELAPFAAKLNEPINLQQFAAAATREYTPAVIEQTWRDYLTNEDDNPDEWEAYAYEYTSEYPMPKPNQTGFAVRHELSHEELIDLALASATR